MKYMHDLLIVTGMLGSKPMETPMELNVKLEGEGSPDFLVKKRYRSLLGKLIYLIVTSDITFSVSAISQFMEAPN